MRSELEYYWRMISGVRKWVRRPIDPEFAATIHTQRSERSARFLGLLEANVWPNPRHPYHLLFRHAGIEEAELQALVRKEGLESALQSLYRAGVFLTHDEFKGHTPVRRGSLTIDLQPSQLANQRSAGGLQSTSSGSRGRPTSSRRSVEYQMYREAQDSLLAERLSTSGRPAVLLCAILPSMIAIRRSLSAHRRGHPIRHWFSAAGAWEQNAHYRAVTKAVVITARLHGARLPFPEYLPPGDFSPVARYLAKLVGQGRPPYFFGPVSSTARVALAALDLGLDISGTVVSCGGEALTNPKRSIFERAGVTALGQYNISEVGLIGVGCAHMNRNNTVHVMDDAYAVITRQRTPPLSDTEVDSLLFTSALPWASFVLVNVEMDDAGSIEPAACPPSCPLHAFGYTRQMRDVFSYGKLTGQGVTIFANGLLPLIEQHLPARFGGAAGDYQLVEVEAPGQTNLQLRVHPRVTLPAESEVRGYFLSSISQLYGGSLTSPAVHPFRRP